MKKRPILTRKLIRNIKVWGKMGYRSQNERLCGDYNSSKEIDEERTELAEQVLQEILEKIVSYENYK